MADIGETYTPGDRREKHPELYGQTNIDRRTCKREVPMKVLSLGLSRSGTMSTKFALEILGLPTYHYISAIANPPDLKLWEEALGGKYMGDQYPPFERKDWDQLLGHVSAVTDSPACSFGPELIAAYPEAKVIIVQRPFEKWYLSYNNAIITNAQNPLVPLASWLSPSFMGVMARMQNIICRYQFKIRDYQDAEAWRANAERVWREHYDEIRKVTPKERLLEYQLGDGWEPLCRFLGKPVPDVPFPRVNETKVIDEKVGMMIQKAIWDGVKPMLVGMAVVVPAFLLAWWFVRK